MSATGALSVWDKINGWMSPLSGAVDGLLRPLVQPLADKFDSITGDSAEVRSTAEKWRQLSRKVDALGEFEARVVSRVVADWEGEAQRAYRAQMKELATAIDDIASQMSGTAEFLDDAAMEVELAEQLVEDIIRELIEWALIALVVSAATSVITLGLSNVAGAGVAAAKAAHATSKIARIVVKVAAALSRLAALVRKYPLVARVAPFVVKALVGAIVVKPVVKATTGLTGSPLGTAVDTGVKGLAGIAADEYDDQQRGGNGPQTPIRDAVDGPISRIPRVPDSVRDGVDDVDRRIPAPPLTTR